MTKSPRIAFINARWHADVVDRAHEGFLTQAASLMPGAQIEAWDVPGAFEMPQLAKKLALTGKYDAVVAAALVVDGGIYRHDFVAGAVVSGLMQAGMDTGVPVFSAHVVVEPEVFSTGSTGALLDNLSECLTEHFDVEHSTFQLEPAEHAGHEHDQHR